MRPYAPMRPMRHDKKDAAQTELSHVTTSVQTNSEYEERKTSKPKGDRLSTKSGFNQGPMGVSDHLAACE